MWINKKSFNWEGFIYRSLAGIILILFWIATILFFRWWIGSLKEEIQGGPEGIELYLDWRPESDPGWIETFINQGGLR